MESSTSRSSIWSSRPILASVLRRGILQIVQREINYFRSMYREGIFRERKKKERKKEGHGEDIAYKDNYLGCLM
jgi:hypothetical protein